MDTFLATVLHDGSLWLMVACLTVFAGVVVGLFTRSGSETSAHPYEKGGNGGDLGTDMPPEASGREEFEAVLWPRRAGRRRARRHS